MQRAVHLPFMQGAKANMDVVRTFLVTDASELGDETFFEGIRRLRAGHNGVFDLATNRFSIFLSEIVLMFVVSRLTRWFAPRGGREESLRKVDRFNREELRLSREVPGGAAGAATNTEEQAHVRIG